MLAANAMRTTQSPLMPLPCLHGSTVPRELEGKTAIIKGRVKICDYRYSLLIVTVV